MSFRTRLALFFVAALVAVQALTAVLVYEITSRASWMTSPIACPPA